MKIQFFGQKTFSVHGKTQSLVFEPTANTDLDVDVALFSDTESHTYEKAKKTLSLSGEFEISEILLRGFRTENGKNTVFKAFLEETSIVHFGALTEIPMSKTLEQLGENIDVAFICVSEKFSGKKVKELIEKTEPRLVVIGGDAQFFGELNGIMNVQTAETNPLEVLKSKLPDENTDIRILPL